jgi:hypothetical protein
LDGATGPTGAASTIQGPTGPASSSVGEVPIGGIIMWYFGTGGNTNPVAPPANWGLCNGSDYSGKYGTIKSPDLSERFVLGSSTGSAIGTTGGYADPALPSHAHDVYGHTHLYDDRAGTQDYTALGYGQAAYRKQGYDNLGQFSTGGAVIDGQETTLVKPFGVDITGGKYNYPPYYTLAYYIRYDD